MFLLAWTVKEIEIIAHIVSPVYLNDTLNFYHAADRNISLKYDWLAKTTRNRYYHRAIQNQFHVRYKNLFYWFTYFSFLPHDSIVM